MRYIWQDKEWPAFKWSAKTLEAVLAEASYRQGLFSLRPGATRQLLAEAARQVLKGEDAGLVMSRPRSALSPNWAGRILIRAAIPVGQNEWLKRHVLQVRLTRAVVAAQRYRHKHGVYPSMLGALVPAYLGTVPCDPFATDAELRYDAAKGVVWSVGENGNFNPIPEKTPHNMLRFEVDARRYAMRLDDKPFMVGNPLAPRVNRKTTLYR